MKCNYVDVCKLGEKETWEHRGSTLKDAGTMLLAKGPEVIKVFLLFFSFPLPPKMEACSPESSTSSPFAIIN